MNSTIVWIAAAFGSIAVVSLGIAILLRAAGVLRQAWRSRRPDPENGDRS